MPGGRPLSLDPHTANAIVAILERGLPICDACEAAGIGETTFHRWMRRGKSADRKKTRTREETEFWQFWRAVNSARAKGKVQLLDVLQRAATRAEDPDWKAAAWMLERMYPKQFGRKYIRIEGGSFEGDPVPGGGSSAPVVEIRIEGGPVEHPPIVDNVPPPPEP